MNSEIFEELDLIRFLKINEPCVYPGKTKEIRRISTGQASDISLTFVEQMLLAPVDALVSYQPSFYKVHLEEIPRCSSFEITSLWICISKTIVPCYGSFILMPTDWSFDDSFPKHISIRSFAAVCSSIIVTVYDNKIISIMMK
jgi:hypothetical protein